MSYKSYMSYMSYIYHFPQRNRRFKNIEFFVCARHKQNSLSKSPTCFKEVREKIQNETRNTRRL